ncbi:MAG: glycosyltransferase [Deltaproteobacteria bacterium]|nr:glycosyltransferase [Deltaproteobacteria bacterium]
MNVFYGSHTAERKGSAVSLCQLQCSLAGTGFSPVAAFGREGPMADLTRSRGIPTVVLKGKGPLGGQLVLDAWRLLGRYEVGLVHLNCAVSFSKYLGIAARARRLPVLWHLREDPADKPLRRLEGWIRRLSDRIVAVSSDIEEVFRDTGKVVTIYNGVDAERFRCDGERDAVRRELSIPLGAFVFGMVGSVERRKGNLNFLQAAEEAAWHRADVHLVIVGDGRPEAFQELRGFLADRPSLASRVVMTGPRADVPRLLAALDVLVMPSLWEGFPRALIEAMAAGRPAVATAVGEVPRILEDGVTGFVVPRDDPGRLAEALARCLELGPELEEIGRRARARVASSFTVARHVARVTEEYRKVLGWG